VLARIIAVERRAGKGKGKNGAAASVTWTFRGGGDSIKNGEAGKAQDGEGGAGDGDGGENSADEEEPPRVRIERFKRELVLLHALWRDGR
jgi:hypothetical protein